ncbi:Clp protease N-terminal domain-containing protein [Streptomyces sp. NPDC001985]|uniref:Clp protease N-terminal domain-containing protein n=1 Tax=Streptomyces sp. NPDC001985 TaxID=3154406 RepID=UPI0033321A4E
MRTRPAIVEADWSVVGVLGAAWGAVDDGGDTIGTEHLLAALAKARGPVGRALGRTGATMAAQLAVIRDRASRPGSWAGTDDAGGSVPSVEVLGDDGHRGRRLTGAATRAFRSAMEDARRADALSCSVEHLLRGLLADEDSRAAEVLRICGTSPGEVRRLLDDDTLPPAADGLGPELRPTRDTLLGRRPRTGRPFWLRVVLFLARGANLAANPVAWVALETVDQSRRTGQETGTEHLLLAVLATHEVGLRYPHMAGEGAADPEVRSAGGARLAAMGARYAPLLRAVERAGTDLGPDDRPFDAYLDAAGGDGGTGPLVDALLRGGTRARRLLVSLGLDPSARP